MTPDNPQSLLTEYKRLCEVCSEVWSADIGLLCFSNASILHISNRLSNTIGIQNDSPEIQSQHIFTQLLHPKEHNSVVRAHRQTIRHFTKLYLRQNCPPYSDAKYYLRLKMANGNYENHLAFIHPLFYSEQGLPLISFVLLKPGNKVGAEKFSIATSDNHPRLYYSASTNKYVPKENLDLKPIECRILELTAKGYGEVKIAKTLEIKLDLLRYYKKNIYKKYHVSNITEAVYTAIQNADIET